MTQGEESLFYRTPREKDVTPRGHVFNFRAKVGDSTRRLHVIETKRQQVAESAKFLVRLTIYNQGNVVGEIRGREERVGESNILTIINMDNKAWGDAPTYVRGAVRTTLERLITEGVYDALNVTTVGPLGIKAFEAMRDNSLLRVEPSHYHQGDTYIVTRTIALPGRS